MYYEKRKRGDVLPNKQKDTIHSEFATSRHAVIAERYYFNRLDRTALNNIANVPLTYKVWHGMTWYTMRDFFILTFLLVPIGMCPSIFCELKHNGICKHYEYLV